MIAMSSTNGPQKKRRLPWEMRAKQLLDVAEDLFAHRGYDATTIEDIARAADVTRPIVYEHYKSKEGMYVACVQRARTEFETELAASAMAATDLADVVGRSGDAYFAMLERDPHRWAILFSSPAPLSGTLGDTLSDRRFETLARVGAILAPYLPGAEPRTLDAFAHQIGGAAEQLGRWWLRNPDLPRATITDHFRTFVLNGIPTHWRHGRSPGDAHGPDAPVL